MSFGTFTLFGFYQQPNKIGILFPVDLTAEEKQFVLSDNAKTGTVNDTNWFFSYAKSAVPVEIIQGGGGSFPITLLSDDDSIGIRYPKFKINISGNFYSDINIAEMKCAINGRFFPKDTELLNNPIAVSGLISGVKFDYCHNLVALSGSVFDIKPDIPNLLNIVSGSINNNNVDIKVLNSKISGLFSRVNPDFPHIFTKISGKFFPVKNDYAKIEYLLTGWKTKLNYGFTGINLQDDSNITYFLEGYSSSEPV